MKLNKNILEFKEVFYKDENNNIVLNIFWNSLYLAFFLLPLGINLSTPFFIVSITLGCVNIFKSQKKFIYDNKSLLLFPIYFAILSISLTYTSNFNDGISLLQRSLTLLLFPIIFLFVKEDALTVRKLFDFLLLGLVVSFFINFSISGYHTFSIVKNDISYQFSTQNLHLLLGAFNDGWNYFIGSEFSKLVSPSYISIYILLVLSFYLKKKLETKLQVFIIIILFLYLFLLAFIAAYLILGIMSLLLIFNISDKSRKYTMFIIFILGLIVFLNNPHIFNFDNKVGPSEIKNETIGTSEKLRILSWETSVKLIKEAPLFGYGLGDANDVLIKKYKEIGYLENHKQKYNAHNQFLQTWLQTGIIGIGALLFIFILLGIRMRRSPNEFSVFLILFISLLFESMLVRFNGIVFFSIVVPLLLKKRSILSSRIIRNNVLLKNRLK